MTPEDIQIRYLVALAESITPVLDWWEAMIARDGERSALGRWPRGPASHPRILGIFREFHAEALELYESTAVEGAPVSITFADDAAWGATEPVQQFPVVPRPEQLLLDDIADDFPAFHEFLCNMRMHPVGCFAPPRPTLEQFAALPENARPRAFEVEVLHDVDLGVLRLLSAPADLRPTNSTPRPNSVHVAAHRAYCRDLEHALIEAERWWRGLVRDSTSQGRGDDEALEDAYAFCIAGPAGHGQVLGVLQTYWALCEQLDATLPAEQYVAPELFLLDWLRDGKHESWVRILSGLPYWPIGLDAEGNWF